MSKSVPIHVKIVDNEGDVVDIIPEGGSGLAVTTLCLKTEFAYNASGDLEYVGRALPYALDSAPVWQICKFIYDGENLTSTKYADGNDKFDKIWDAREDYDY